MRQGEAAGVVQQLMFNRILTFLRNLSCEQVTLAGFDAKTGTIEGNLAGINFVVNIGLAEKAAQRGAAELKARSVRGGPPAAPTSHLVGVKEERNVD
jgi:hypothetical protein